MANNGTTGHETEAINVQDLKASLQKFKTDKVDPKVTEGYYYNKKFYKEAAHTTEITGAGGRIYIDKDTNREYRFDGTKYVLLKSEVDGSFVSEGTFAYRPTAGALDVESGAVGEGGAQIECVKGNTIAWNQLVENGNFADGTTGWLCGSATLSASDNILSIALETGAPSYTSAYREFNYSVGHVFYCSEYIKSPSQSNGNYFGLYGCEQQAVFSANVWTKLSSISRLNATPSVYRFLLLTNLGNVVSTDEQIQFKDALCIDLTLIYGEGNEPTTPEQFESDYQKWFGKPLTYEEYDEGSLRSVEMTGIKTVGFNAWDGELVAGYIVNGEIIGHPSYRASKNYIPIIPNTKYYFKNPSQVNCPLFFYDADKNYTEVWSGNVSYKHQNRVFTTPSNARYCRFYFNGMPDNPNACINLSHSGDRNGDYEPYWEHTANLPVTQLKGKLNGEGESVVIFPDGMKKAGDVYDEIVKRGNQTVAIKRIGKVDLGSLRWYYNSSKQLFVSNLTNAKTGGNGDKSNIECGKYVTNTQIQNENLNIGIALYSPQYKFLTVYDPNYGSDYTAFATAMSGVELYYELETPQEYIIDDIDFPTEYPVDDYGTEEILSDSAKSLAPTLDIRYGLNATDTLRNLPSKYVSAVEEQNFTEAQKERACKNIGLEKGAANGAATLDENGHLKTEQLEGEYPDSVSGNIVGEFSDEAEMSFRPTAAAVDITSGKASKGAKLMAVKGNTIAWNQLFLGGNFINAEGFGKNGVTLTVSNNVGTITATAVGGLSIYKNIKPAAISHKYYFNYTLKSDDGIKCGCGYGGMYLTELWTTTNSWSSYRTILQVSNNSPHAYLFVSPSESGQIVYAKNLMFFDLTLIYGEGNEPTTPEQFEADYQKWFGKPLTYEEYDEGSLRSVEMTGIKTVGFNQWDEEYESGWYRAETGVFVGDSTQICTKNKIKILPNTQYCLKIPVEGLNVILYYDTDGNFLGVGNWISSNGFALFTTLANAYYMNIDFGMGYGTTYNHDICINLHHSGARDGEYEPYWTSMLNVPVTTLKGKLNGEGSSVVVFPDGMKKVGDVYDEIVRRGNQTYAIKRVGSVDLGTLSWQYFETYNKFRTNSFEGAKKPDSVYTNLNALSTKYNATSDAIINQSTTDKVVAMDNSKYLYVKDKSYDNTSLIDGHASWLDGVMLYYELATPQEYLLDDFELPQNYDVDDYGTEEVQLGTNGCVPVLDVKYGINAGDTIKNLPHSYVSAVGEQSFTEAQKKRARVNIGAASQKEFVKVKKMVEAISPKVDNDYYVDMGLPSGLLWAKRNIFTGTGNDKGFAPSEYTYDASFFSWGNKEGHNPNGTTFDYDFGSSNDGPYASTEGAKLTGNIPLSQDAARFNCGEPWRVPTATEYQELFDNCDFIDANGDVIASTTTNKLITMTSTVGIRLKSKINGNILFFPCSGVAVETEWKFFVMNGHYWSNNLASVLSGARVYFHSGGIDIQGEDQRWYGFPIRPVM